MRPFSGTLRLAGRGVFCASPLSHSPPKYFTSWERTRYASLLTSRKPSFQQQPRKDEQNHEHRHRPWLLRHQDPAFFFPSRYLGIFSRTLHPAEHAGVRWKVLCVRDRQTADPAKQDGERELLPADPCGHRQRDPAAGRQDGVFRHHRSRPSSGRVWAGEEVFPGVPSPFFPAGKDRDL